MTDICDLVAVHGLGSTAAVWDRFGERLSEPVTMHAPDLPWSGRDGNGWSWKGTPSSHLTAGWPLGAAADAIVVGHSFGANAVLRLVATGELTPRLLVLVSPFFRPAPGDFSWADLEHYVMDFIDLVQEGIEHSGVKIDPSRVTATVERARDRIGPYGWLRFFESYLASPMLDLGKASMPCLVVCGADDTASYPKDSRNLAAALPDGHYVQFQDAGHFVMLDHPARFADLVNEFITSHDAAHPPNECAGGRA